MEEYKEQRETVDVPRGTGVEGFLRAIGEILKLPRVQEVKVDARGKVSYIRFLREGENSKPVAVDFETLMPYAILRNSSVQELDAHSTDASKVVSAIFDVVSRDHLYPVAFVGGANTVFFEWYKSTTGVELYSTEEVYGLPFYRDRMVEDYMLFLAAAYGRHSALVDVQKSYKILMPSREPPLRAPDGVKVL